jgi:ribonuclease Z
MTHSVRFFGTSAAAPSLSRGFACIGLVQRTDSGSEEITLLDCGDGSIRKIMETGTSSLAISTILITHYHSDHLSGLPQIVETMSIEGRTKRLDIYGPAGLKDYFSTIQKTTNAALNRHFGLSLHELEDNEKVSINGDDGYRVTPLFMRHTVPCLGYRVEHSDFIVSYTGDTEPCENVVSLGKNADILIHEATYLTRDLSKARETKHSTPREALNVAIQAHAKCLILTHINDRRETDKEILEEVDGGASSPKITIAHDGLEVKL